VTARLASLALLLFSTATRHAPAAEPVTLVACAPGYPGSTAEAQPRMDAFADALAAATGAREGSIRSEYYETEEAGALRLGRPDAAFALVPLPFFLKYEEKLRFAARAQAVRQGGAASEAWSLVAGKGRVSSAAALRGWEIVSPAAYAPRFVRGAALGAWGTLPAGTRLVTSGAVLSSLRRAAAGDDVALLLDAAQAAALPTLPYAKDLEVVARSAPLPVMVVASVAGRLEAARVKQLVRALQSLQDRPAGASALVGLQLVRFMALDEAALGRAREAYRAAPDAP
jgi:hypothetical protein